MSQRSYQGRDIARTTILTNFEKAIPRKSGDPTRDGLSAHIIDAMTHADNCNIPISLQSAQDAMKTAYRLAKGRPQETTWDAVETLITQLLVEVAGRLNDCGCHQHPRASQRD